MRRLRWDTRNSGRSNTTHVEDLSIRARARARASTRRRVASTHGVFCLRTVTSKGDSHAAAARCGHGHEKAAQSASSQRGRAIPERGPNVNDPPAVRCLSIRPSVSISVSGLVFAGLCHQSVCLSVGGLLLSLCLPCLSGHIPIPG